ncbi:hypothetical protein RI129_012503 [Pyrocoelia pectoralis]|uniref:Uncharacterized protein n=1 Tax=Pyrocoelia pectoralis TaxID=417401 RepID=A0AAN7V2D4_9COLE
MARLVLLFVAIFANQALASIHSNYDLGNYLNEIKTEISDLTVYLEHFFPDNHHAITTVTWQCHRVAEEIQNIINKLGDETTKQHESGVVIFKQLWFSLQEVHTTLQQIALSSDVTDVSEIKNQLILNLQLCYETLEKMMHVTYIHYPEFRTTLKTIFADFLKGLRDIHKTFRMEKNEVSQRTSLKYLVMDITKFSQRISFRLKEATPESFAWFYEGVDRIVYELEMKRTVGDDEINVVLKHLTSNLRKLMYDRDFGDVATLFEELVHFIENGSQHEAADRFIQKIVYDYFKLIKRMSEQLERHQLHYGEEPTMIYGKVFKNRW